MGYWVMTSKKFKNSMTSFLSFFVRLICISRCCSDHVPVTALVKHCKESAYCPRMCAESSHFALAASLCVMFMRPLDCNKYCSVVMSVHVPLQKRKGLLLIVNKPFDMAFLRHPHI